MLAECDIVLAVLSVCPTSVCHIMELYLNEYIARVIKIFPPSDRGMTPVFRMLLLLQNSKGNSLSLDVKYMGWENLAIFDRNCHLSRKL